MWILPLKQPVWFRNQILMPCGTVMLFQASAVSQDILGLLAWVSD